MKLAPSKSLRSFIQLLLRMIQKPNWVIAARVVAIRVMPSLSTPIKMTLSKLLSAEEQGIVEKSSVVQGVDGHRRV